MDWDAPFLITFPMIDPDPVVLQVVSVQCDQLRNSETSQSHCKDHGYVPLGTADNTSTGVTGLKHHTAQFVAIEVDVNLLLPSQSTSTKTTTSAKRKSKAPAIAMQEITHSTWLSVYIKRLTGPFYSRNGWSLLPEPRDQLA